MAEFVTPEFLANKSVEEIHERMKSVLPSDIDLSEGGHGWNMTIATALIASELCEFILPEVIKLVFPEWSYGEFLDGHAKARSITRRAATPSVGQITITGEPTTEIPAGSLFSTAAVNDEPSVEYATLEDVTIPEGGSITVEVECTQTGIVGNTAENTIVLVASKLTGVTGVTNTEATTGGTEEEDDESLQERIVEYDRSQGESYSGSIADYKRWAKSVAGVGEATVVPATDDTGLVTIIITDSNGAPASSQLCESVYNYIMKPNAPGERLAPVNAILSVQPPATTAIGIRATVELETNATIEAVKASYLAQLALYLPVALEEGEIKYTRIAAALAASEGANDYSGLEIGIITDGEITYGTSNIPITTAQLPTIEESALILTEGIV